MVDAGSIDAAAAEQAQAHPASLPAAGRAAGLTATPPTSRPPRPSVLGEVGGSFTVETTIDRRLQALAEQVIGDWLAREGDARREQAALVALGAGWRGAGHGRRPGLRARASSIAPRRRGASPARCSSSSSISPPSRGQSPDSPIEDAPLQIADWQPRDYSASYLGPTDLRTAFAQSLNPPPSGCRSRSGASR